MFLDYCLNNVQFGGGNEHHICKDQSLFFYLLITCYYKYATGLHLFFFFFNGAPNKRRQTSMPLAGVETTIPVFKRAKAFYALDHAATVSGRSSVISN
jgi:hypothetical protein